MKRISVVLLSLIIALSMFPSMAFAEGEAVVKSKQASPRIDFQDDGITVYMQGKKSTEAQIAVAENPGDVYDFNVGECTVTSAKPKVATVTKTNQTLDLIDGLTYRVYLIKGVKAGSTKIKVNFAGNNDYEALTKSISVTVKNARKLKAANVSLSKSTYKYDGKEHKPTVTVKWDGKKVDSKYYDVSRPEKPVALGTYTISVKGTNGLYYGTAKKAYTIVKGDQEVKAECDKTKLHSYKDETATIKFEKSSIGVEKASFKVSDNKMLKITKSDDKTCTLKAIGTKTGTATVTMTVKGTENYNDFTQDFKIKVVAGDLSKAKIELSKDTYTYSGAKCKPAVSVKLDGETVPTSEYSVSYSNNVNAGTAKVKITAKKGSKIYTGSKTKSYKINKAYQTLKIVTTPTDRIIPANRRNHDVFQIKVKSLRKGTTKVTDVDLTKVRISTSDANKALRTGKLFELTKNPTNLVTGGYAVCKFEAAERNTFSKKEKQLTFKISSPETTNYKAVTAEVVFTVK